MQKEDSLSHFCLIGINNNSKIGLGTGRNLQRTASSMLSFYSKESGPVWLNDSLKVTQLKLDTMSPDF